MAKRIIQGVSLLCLINYLIMNKFSLIEHKLNLTLFMYINIISFKITMIMILIVGVTTGVTLWTYIETDSFLFALLMSFFSFSFYDRLCVYNKSTIDVESLLLFPCNVFRKFNLYLSLHLYGMRGLLLITSLLLLFILSIITNTTLLLIPLFLLGYIIYSILATMMHILIQKNKFFRPLFEIFVIMYFIMHMLVVSGKLTELALSYKISVYTFLILITFICFLYILSFFSFKYLIRYKPLATSKI